MTSNNSTSTQILTALIISVVDPGNRFANLQNQPMPICTDLPNFVLGACAIAERNDIKMSTVINANADSWYWADFFVQHRQSELRNFNFLQTVQIAAIDDEKERQSQIANYAQFITHLSIEKFGTLLKNEQWTQQCLAVLISECNSEEIRSKLMEKVSDTRFYWNEPAITREYQPSATPGQDSNYDGSASIKEASVESSLS